MSQTRYKTANISTATFAVTAGRNQASNAQGAAPTAFPPIITLGQFRGVKLTPFGIGADDATFNYLVYRIPKCVGSSPNMGGQPLVREYVAELFGAGTVTLSTRLGSDSNPDSLTITGVLTTERVADTITWALASSATSPPGVGTKLVEALDLLVPTFYSPGSNADDASLIIPDFGDADGFMIDFDMTGATSGNFMYELLR